jgi:hypothetical protein
MARTPYSFNQQLETKDDAATFTRETYILQLPRKVFVCLCFLHHLEELILLNCSVRVERKQTPDIGTRDDVNKVEVDFSADFIVLVKDALVGFVLVNPTETVVQVADIDDTARQTHTAT